jgi:hypothetical protein
LNCYFFLTWVAFCSSSFSFILYKVSIFVIISLMGYCYLLL